MNVTRGAIRNGKWLIPGVTGPHRLTLDSGRLGSGPMHAKVDGRLVATFPKPNRRLPVVYASAGVIDGYDLAVYAESRNNGNLVDADIFISGRSLLTGELTTVAAYRGADASAASAELARTGCLAQAVNLIWIVPMTSLLGAFRNFRGPNAILGVIVAAVVAIAVTAIVGYVLENALRRPTLARDGAIALAVGGFAIVFVGCIVGIVIGTLVGTR